MLRRFASHQKKMTLKPQGDLGPTHLPRSRIAEEN